MYFISVIATLAILYVFAFWGIGMERVRYFIDLPSLCLPVLICIPVLFSCGLQKDFFRAFRLAPEHKTASSLQKIRAKQALALVMKTLMLTGGLVAAFSLILISADSASNSGDMGYFFALFAVSLICPFYTLVITLLLLPLYEKLKLSLLENTEDSK